MQREEVHGRSFDMKKRMRVLAVMLVSLVAPSLWAQGATYPPLSEYLMPRDAELALARSAAPANIADRATLRVLTTSGYQVAREGDNGFVCLVMRGWTAPTYTPVQVRDLVYDASVRAPICFDPVASRTVRPYYELRTKLGLEGKTPDQIAEGVQAAYAKAALPRRDGVSFAYMWSADQNLGPGVGHWHPHMMVFSPYYENAMLGGHPHGEQNDGAGSGNSVIAAADAVDGGSTIARKNAQARVRSW
jgi:hypothetical protein